MKHLRKHGSKFAMLAALIVLMVAMIACEGPAGVAGPPGASGAPGAHGQHGMDGEQGEQGEQGEPGMDGMHGIDALQAKDDTILIPSALTAGSHVRHDVKQYFRGGKGELLYTVDFVETYADAAAMKAGTMGSSPKYTVAKGVSADEGFITIGVAGGTDPFTVIVVRATDDDGFYADAMLTIKADA